MLQEKHLRTLQGATDARELEQAFLDFSQASDSLSEIYQNLEQQVANLNTELLATRNERAYQYKEKERIAGRLQSLLDVLPAGIVVLDCNGVITEHNPAAKDLLGDALIGEAWRDVVECRFCPRWDDGHDVTLKDGRCVNLSTQSLEGEVGQIILIKEVTETKQLQQQLDRMKRLSAMGEMASSLAHQIRTPLSTALLYSSNLRRPNLEDNLKDRFVGKLMNRLQHLESLVDDMLLFARGGGFDAKPCDFSLLLEEFRESVEVELAQKRASLVLQNKTVNSMVNVNRHALISTLQNLLTNAIQASEHPLNILITLDTKDEYLCITFSDDGPGIEKNVQDKIFEPFYTTRDQGTGLGLTVADAVIRSHGGKISLQSEPGKGTSFIITLPIIEKQGE